MKKLFRLFHSRINNKLVLLSVLPVAVVTAIITSHTIDTRQAEIEDYQIKTASMVARNLAKISDFALFYGRKDILKPLATSADEIPAITGIGFLDADRALLLGETLPSQITEEVLLSGNYPANDAFFVVEEPVYATGIEVSDYDESRDAQSVLLGWVVVVGDQSATLAKSHEIVMSHLLISFSVLLGAVILTYFLSNHVVSPVRDMTRVVRELERGNLKARIMPKTGDELAILANGINHLARAVEESRDSLESKVELSTHRLTLSLEDLKRKNRELEAARREAEEASSAKGDFLAHMSHELRTPITAIQGFVRLLSSADLKPAEARYCNIIQQASGQLLQLIDDILDITRLQSNAIILDNAPFDLAECVEAPLSLMAPIAHQKGVELILDIAPNVPYQLDGDSLRIRQIIYNLISNAIKFTPAGHVIVRLKISDRENENIVLLVQVIDTGIGIPDRHQAGLFEPFSQADTSISRRFGGSGLGLSIVKKLVDLMQGEIRLDSTTGKGTAFTLKLPLRTRVQAPADSALCRRLLLYDSHPESRQALENILSRYVEVVDSCDTMDDVEMSVSDMSPEIIIYSPRCDTGFETLEAEVIQLRRICEALIVVLIPTTNIYQNQPSSRLEKYGPIRFLDKPPMSPELAQVFAPPGSDVKVVGDEEKRLLGARILVAEDNEFTRILLSAFFEDTGCTLTLAYDGGEAVQACKAERFDLVLMDVHMPEVNGIAALREIRRDSKNRETPIIMLTADILQQEENALFDLGASDLVFKPFDEDKLLSAIRRHLQRRGADTAEKRAVDASKKVDQRQLFSQEVERLTGVAKDALEGKEEERLRDAIHQLLGIAGVYQMPYLERAVRALHQSVKSKNGNKIVAAMETLVLEVEKLVAEN